MMTNDAMMIYLTAGIENHIITNFCSAADDTARKSDDSPTKDGGGRDNRRSMNHGENFKSLVKQAAKNSDSSRAIAKSPYSHKSMGNSFMLKIRKLFIGASNRHTRQRASLEGGI